MSRLNVEEQCFRELERELRKHSERDSILFDYTIHLSELMQSTRPNDKTEKEWRAYIIERLGTPQEVALLWEEELSVTRNKTFTHFLLLNLCFFLMGGVLTFLHFIHESAWIQSMWNTLTSVPMLIMLL